MSNVITGRFPKSDCQGEAPSDQNHIDLLFTLSVELTIWKQKAMTVLTEKVGKRQAGRLVGAELRRVADVAERE